MLEVKKFAVFDIDGTLIRWQLYHAVVSRLASLGYIPKAKFEPIKQARMTWKRREGEESYRKYENELVKIVEDVLTSVNVQQFEEASQLVFDEYKDQVYTYTRDLIKELKAKGYLLFAISGSHAQAIAKMADYYGFDDFVAFEGEHDGKKFSGKYMTPVHDKDVHLRALVEKNKASWEGSIAVGDSNSDIKMLELVEQPIAFNPEKRLLDHARKEGWKIVVERKNVTYELETDGGGYKLI